MTRVDTSSRSEPHSIKLQSPLSLSRDPRCSTSPASDHTAMNWASMFPDEVWDHIFSFLPSTGGDRNAVASTCRSWYRIDRFSRRKIFVGNCYAVSPEVAVSRFPEVREVEIKGKPHFADFNLVPSEWGAYADTWVAAMADAWPDLEVIRFKRMVVGDECMEVIAKSFRNLKGIGFVCCEGFSTSGLAAIARNCRKLQELDIQETEVEDTCGHWISHFPESSTSLVSLNIACLDGEVNVSILERLVSRCTNLKSLRLNHTVPLDRLVGLIRRAPQLFELGTGRFGAEERTELYTKLESAFSGCKNLKSLSGIWEAVPSYLPTLYSVCNGLTALNLNYATLQSQDIIKLVSRCKNLRRLWVMDFIEDTGLEAVAASCKDLQELRVFPSDPYGAAQPVGLTERGLVSVSFGCPKLHSVLYFCRQMTNDALITVATNRPNLTRFRLCIIDPHTPDYITQQSLDAGFSAIVESCKTLRRLSLSGLLTDRVFKSIGSSADRLEMLSVAFAGDSDAGLHYILSGCRSLRKLEIRDCPFGDKALLANADKLETMRSLWMSSCNVTLGACRVLASRMPRLNVEAIDERRGGEWDSLPNECPVEKLYVYRTVAGPRTDTPPCVRTL